MVDISIHHSKERVRNLKGLHRASNSSFLMFPEGNADKPPLEHSAPCTLTRLSHT